MSPWGAYDCYRPPPPFSSNLPACLPSLSTRLQPRAFSLKGFLKKLTQMFGVYVQPENYSSQGGLSYTHQPFPNRPYTEINAAFLCSFSYDLSRGSLHAYHCFCSTQARCTHPDEAVFTIPSVTAAPSILLPCSSARGNGGSSHQIRRERPLDLVDLDLFSEDAEVTLRVRRFVVDRGRQLPLREDNRGGGYQRTQAATHGKEGNIDEFRTRNTALTIVREMTAEGDISWNT